MEDEAEEDEEEEGDATDSDSSRPDPESRSVSEGMKKLTMIKHKEDEKMTKRAKDKAVSCKMGQSMRKE